jgi:phage shock protein C
MEQATRPSTLMRSVDDRVTAGVCGGLATHLDVDSSWVRMGFIVGAMFWGLGLIAYALLWITLPEEPEEEGGPMRPPIATQDPKAVAGILLLCLGLLVIMWNILAHLSFWIVLPVLLVGLGLFLLVHRQSV